MIGPTRSHRSYLAAMAHRVSGLALALFLPVHFLLLGTALNDEAAFDEALAFTAMPLVKIAEWGLVVFLCLHLLFGLRVLVLELGGDSDPRANLASWVIPSTLLALVVGAVFVVRIL